MNGLLALDRGNRRLKAALFEGGRIVRRWSPPPEGAIAPLLAESGARGVVYSSVVPSWTETLDTDLRSFGGPVIGVRAGCRLPFELRVREPRSLGSDRIAAACGAVAGGHSTAVIVDAGTAVTVDSLTERGFAGGAIFPGLELIVHSLHAGTAVLPEVEGVDGTIAPPGGGTEEAIAAGAFYGLAGAVAELVARSLEALEGNAPVLLTGGLAPLLVDAIGCPAIHEPDLVMLGLELVYRLNTPDLNKNC